MLDMCAACVICIICHLLCVLCAVCVMCLMFAVCVMCVMCAVCNICADLKSPYLKFLLFLKNELVVCDSDQLTLNHCPPIHLHCPDCFCQGSDDVQWLFL